MVTIDSSVVSTYNELAYAASLSYSCAMDVTVAQAGVMDAIYTVRRICLESFTPANVLIIFIKINKFPGYQSYFYILHDPFLYYLCFSKTRK